MSLALLSLATVLAQSWSPSRLLQEQRRDIGRFESELVQWFGGHDRLSKGADPHLDDLTVAWAIESPGTKEAVIRSEDGMRNPPFELKLKRVGKSGLFAAAATLPEGDSFRWRYVVDGEPIGNPRELEVYTAPPESKGSPGGTLEPRPPLTSKIFGGTHHDWWIYTPAGFDPVKEANLVIYQDGQWAHNYAPVYFDHVLPQTIVVFVTPGTFPNGQSDRSREYDTLSDAYVRFLLEELLPPVEARFKIAQDPMRRCVAGLSSGGICSFTCAWQRPDKFGLVMSWIGSFTDIASGPTLIEGGHNYPALIRKTPKKPIRVFLQDGENDLDNIHGNWPFANREMALALQFSKYDIKTIWGKGFHSDKQGRATMVEALRWLFAR